MKQFVDQFENRVNTTWAVGDFLIGPSLGCGKFGTVHVVKHAESLKKYALKVVYPSFAEDTEQILTNEITNLSRVSYPNIIELFGVFTDDSRYYLLMELVTGGDLYSKMKAAEHKRLAEPFVARCTRQLCFALKYLHDLHIIHRDVKPENVLLDESGENVKLCDFGWSCYTRKRETQLCGTLDYLSPELVLMRPYDHNVDIWALGVLVFDTITGKPPFVRETYKKTYEAIANVAYRVPDHVSEKASNFCAVIFMEKVAERATIDQLLLHPFLNQ
jgi:serine/threonine protein kinase